MTFIKKYDIIFIESKGYEKSRKELITMRDKSCPAFEVDCVINFWDLAAYTEWLVGPQEGEE